MKKTNPIYYLFVCLIFVSCTDNITTIETDSHGKNNLNIILSSSFENADGASYDGWTNPGPPVVKLTNEAPASGGSYSIFLKAQSMGAEVYKSVSAIEGTHKYKLTFWSRATEDAGTIEISLKQGANLVGRKVLWPKSKEWAEYSVETQYTAVAGDRIEIKLNGSLYKVPQGFTYFDLILLERLD